MTVLTTTTRNTSTMATIIIASSSSSSSSKPPPPSSLSSLGFGRRTSSSLQQLLLEVSAEQLTTTTALLRKSTNQKKDYVSSSSKDTAVRISSNREDKIDENSPQAYLTAALKARGYSTLDDDDDDTGYYHHSNDMKPMTDLLQLASYGTFFRNAVKSSNYVQVQRLLDVGLSPNACNQYGESLLHLICRMGDKQMLQKCS